MYFLLGRKFWLIDLLSYWIENLERAKKLVLEFLILLSLDVFAVKPNLFA